MNEETKRALELARDVLEQSDPKWGERIRAMTAIDTALSAPAAPVAQPLTACHVAVIGDRWDSERLHHVPQLLIEFEPVPVNTGNTAKGWVDRDSLAKILKGIGQAAAPAAPRAPMTDQQIDDLYDRYLDCAGGDALQFARAIERAHGIGQGGA